jgi:hypothetical protein
MSRRGENARRVGNVGAFRLDRGGVCVGCIEGISSCLESGSRSASSREVVTAIMTSPSSCSPSDLLLNAIVLTLWRKDGLLLAVVDGVRGREGKISCAAPGGWWVRVGRLLWCAFGWGTAEECTTASEGKPVGSETGVRGSYGDELAGATGPGRSAAAVHRQEADKKGRIASVRIEGG